MGIGKRLLHFFGYGNNGDRNNLEKEDKDIKSSSVLRKVSYRIYISIWRFIIQVKKDKSWEDSTMQFVFSTIFGPREVKKDEEEPETPLFAAIRTGNAELVKLILKEHSQAIELINHRNQNILHMAAIYRQKEIFDIVKTKEIPMMRLARRIDEKGYTILQSVADMKHYKGGTRFGPAYQLQEELDWFNKIVPSYYTMLTDDSKKTAYEIFKEEHRAQHKDSQKWIKETSQSCSTVAVLVTTVVFAAAFTVLGGTNDANGKKYRIFPTVSLSCSLTSVVMFLSVITSPFELEDFQVSLPRRLTLGFALLFMFVATTMLAFTSTIFLIIRLASVDVSVLAPTHFPLFVSFINGWKNLFMSIWDALPCSLVLRNLKFLGNSVTRHLLSKDKEK
ncbi:hypothetical protein ACOSQ2_013138 [Xanthoceras sorbifolium]